MSQNNIASRASIPLIISVLGAGFTTGLIPSGLLPANVLNIEREYGLSHAEMGRFIGICMVVGGGLGGLIGGWLCGRIGAIRTLLVALVMVSAALGTVGLANSLYLTALGLGGYFFAGGFMGAQNPLATHMLQDRQRGVTLLHGVNATGKLAGPILASLFLLGAWKHSFLAAAALPAVLIFVLLTAHRNNDTSIGRKRDGDGHPGAFFWLAIAGFAFIAGSEIAVALWIPAYAQKVRGFSAAQGNILLSFFLLGLISGRFAASGLSSVINSRQTIGLCAVMLVFVLPAVNAKTYFASAAFFLLFGIGFSAVWPSYFAHLSRVFPAHLGLMGGAAFLSTQVGFAMCSFVSGRLAEIHLTYPMWFAAFLLAGFVLVFFASPLSRMGKAEVAPAVEQGLYD